MSTATALEPAVDAKEFRRVLSNFASGIVVVTGVVDRAPAGMTCQSFTALSLAPPLVLFCPAKTSTSWPVLARAPMLCINVLSSHQRPVSDAFARSGTDKFAGVEWTMTDSGTPALIGAATHIEARVEAVHDGGDHHIVVCRVVTLNAADHLHPLLYHRSSYRLLRPEPSK